MILGIINYGEVLKAEFCVCSDVGAETVASSGGVVGHARFICTLVLHCTYVSRATCKSVVRCLSTWWMCKISVILI